MAGLLKKRKGKVVAQSSSEVPRFKTLFHEAHFKGKLFARKVLPEVAIDYNDDILSPCAIQIKMRKWEKFYANAWEPDKAKRKPYTYTTMVQGKDINFAPKDIKRVLKLRKDPLPNAASYHERKTNKDYRLEEVQECLCLEGREWVRHRDGRPHYLKRNDLEPMAKGWYDFVCRSILPTTNRSELTVERAVVIHSIIIGENINVEEIIADQFYKFVYVRLMWQIEVKNIGCVCLDAQWRDGNRVYALSLASRLFRYRFKLGKLAKRSSGFFESSISASSSLPLWLCGELVYKTDLSSSLPFPSIIVALCLDAKVTTLKGDTLINQEVPIVGEAMIRTRETRPRNPRQEAPPQRQPPQEQPQPQVHQQQEFPPNFYTHFDASMSQIYRRLDSQQEESRKSFEAINTRMDRMDDQLSFLCYSNQMSNEQMLFPYQNTARQFKEMEMQGIPVTMANLALHRQKEEEINQERMRYDQILQEAATQQAREANKGKAREVVPNSEEEDSEELASSASEEW
ncbi:hypothetical protein PIB30_059814 [Stylosanthes scabra]|uniref:Putative plant transposon protein domain-containing protein n=1 Tax=Stylosanthes scabra TaxID=79078 RepID=A0ABU6QKQ3_9FABA|nr:hypothetical protein [Stylosanthes scabra]